MRILGNMGDNQPTNNSGFRQLGNVDSLGAGLSSSNNTRENILKTSSAFQLPGQETASNIATGVTKGEIRTATGFASLGKSFANMISGIFGRKETSSDSLISGLEKASVPQGTAQNIGYTAEKIGEFFVPGGAEKKLYAKGAEVLAKVPEAIGLTGTGAKVASGLLKTGLKAGITGASAAGVTAAQTGGDMSQVKTSGVAGTIAGGLSQALETFGTGLANALQKADFKLSPAAEAKASQKIDNAAQFMTQNKILGSDESKFEKLVGINNKLESTLQSSLPKTVSVSKSSIIENINSRVEKLRTDDPAIYNSARKDADEAIALLQSQKSNTIQGSVTVQDALKGKRSYGQQAFKTTKYAVKDPRVVSEGSYAVEQGYQEALLNALDTTNSTIKVPLSLSNMFGGVKEVSMQDFNKVYSNAISAKSLSGLSRFKKDTGILGRFFGLWVGESIGQAVMPGLGGKIAGATIGELAATRLPGVVRRVGESAISKAETIPKAAKVGLGVFNQPNQDGNQVTQ